MKPDEEAENDQVDVKEEVPNDHDDKPNPVDWDHKDQIDLDVKPNEEVNHWLDEVVDWDENVDVNLESEPDHEINDNFHDPHDPVFHPENGKCEESNDDKEWPGNPSKDHQEDLDEFPVKSHLYIHAFKFNTKEQFNQVL